MRKNVDPREWGWCAWDFIFRCCEGSDREANKKLHEFANLMTHILPCERCRFHLKAHLAEFPFDEVNPAAWFEDLRAAIKMRRGGANQACSCSKSGARFWIKAFVALVVLAALLAYIIMKLA